MASEAIFGRSGEEFGATTYNMRPQMASLAKALSSAYIPLSAAIIEGEMFDAMVDQANEVGVFGHGYTYGGHPVACAVGSKVIEIYERDKVFEHARDVGAYMQGKIREFADHPLVGEVRGVGMIGAVELVANKETRKAFADNSVGGYCQKQCEKNGLIVRAMGGNSIALCPPLILTVEQVDEICSKLAVALEETLAWAKKSHVLA